MDSTSLVVSHHSERFLLRSLAHQRQYHHLYLSRLELLSPFILAKVPHYSLTRIQHVHSTGSVLFCLGVVTREDSNDKSFLEGYTQRLAKLDAGGDDVEGVTSATLLAPASITANTATDSFFLEDASGRLALSISNEPVLVPGMVLGVLGRLDESTGQRGLFKVEQTVLPGDILIQPIPPLMPSTAAVTAVPNNCYVALLGGLNLNVSDDPPPFALRQFQRILAGEEDLSKGSRHIAGKSINISRIILGGNLMEPSEDVRLKYKIQLERRDHQLVSIRNVESSSANREESNSHHGSSDADGHSTAHHPTTPHNSATAMSPVDSFIASCLPFADVDVMPGESDPSNAVLPQQPLHRLYFPTCFNEGNDQSRNSSGKNHKLRLLTNPFDGTFHTLQQPASKEVPFVLSAIRVLLSSGSNVLSVLAQHPLLSSVDVLCHQFGWRHLSPMSPNSVLSHPYQTDPFVFPEGISLNIAFNQPTYGTACNILNDRVIRVVSVPSFSDTGTIVLLNIANLYEEPMILSL